jgi:hypothetical protein
LVVLLLKPVPCPLRLQAAVDACTSAGLPAETTAGLLAIFDATRFAVLVCEQAAAATSAGEEGEEGGGSGGGGGGSTSGPMAGVDDLLALAHASLAQPGPVPTGLALLEGVLTLQPASYMAAALQLGLACGAEEALRGVLSMLCRVPVELLPPAVLADALAQLAEAGPAAAAAELPTVEHAAGFERYQVFRRRCCCILVAFVLHSRGWLPHCRTAAWLCAA